MSTGPGLGGGDFFRRRGATGTLRRLAELRLLQQYFHYPGGDSAGFSAAAYACSANRATRLGRDQRRARKGPGL